MPRVRTRSLTQAGVTDILRQEHVAHHHCDSEQSTEDDEDDLEYNSGSTEVQRSCGWQTEAPGYVEADCDGDDGDVVSVARVDRFLLLCSVDVLDVERIEDDEDDSQNEENATHQEQTIPVRFIHWTTAIYDRKQIKAVKFSEKLHVCKFQSHTVRSFHTYKGVESGLK